MFKLGFSFKCNSMYKITFFSIGSSLEMMWTKIKDQFLSIISLTSGQLSFWRNQTFVLFLHAETCLLEFGFNVMINCGKQKRNQIRLAEWINRQTITSTDKIIKKMSAVFHIYAVSSSSHLCFVMHPFSPFPSGPVFLNLPTRCPSTCQRLPAQCSSCG